MYEQVERMENGGEYSWTELFRESDNFDVLWLVWSELEHNKLSDITLEPWSHPKVSRFTTNSCLSMSRWPVVSTFY